MCGVRGPTGGHQLRAGAEHGAVCTVQPVQTGTVHCTHCTHGHQVDTIIAPIHIHNWQCSNQCARPLPLTVIRASCHLTALL